MRVYAVNPTPHHSVRFYVDPRNEQAGNLQAVSFLQMMCIWGDTDHQINGYIGFEVSNDIQEAVRQILEKRYVCTLTPAILL